MVTLGQVRKVPLRDQEILAGTRSHGNGALLRDHQLTDIHCGTAPVRKSDETKPTDIIDFYADMALPVNRFHPVAIAQLPDDGQGGLRSSVLTGASARGAWQSEKHAVAGPGS